MREHCKTTRNHCSLTLRSNAKQVGAKMGKSTRPVYWGRTVIMGHTVVGDMLE